MILGVGSDLCIVARIDNARRRFGERFTRAVFVDAEQAACQTSPTPSLAYARVFAAKEACVKALGTGIADGITWRTIAVTDRPDEEPLVTLFDAAADRLAAFAPLGYRPRLRLTLSDDARVASAFVVIEAVH